MSGAVTAEYKAFLKEIKDRIYKARYDALNGAIEHSFVDESEEGILFKRGIRQHVCDVLEGGEEAWQIKNIYPDHFSKAMVGLLKEKY